MDAYFTAITADLKRKEDTSPYMLQTLLFLAKRSTASLHQIVLHHRDMGIWYSDICASMIGRVHHTPFLGASSLYPKEFLNDIPDEQRDEDRHSVIAMAVRKGQSQFSTPIDKLKRKVATPAVHVTPQAKRFKGPAKKVQPQASTQPDTQRTPKQPKHI